MFKSPDTKLRELQRLTRRRAALLEKADKLQPLIEDALNELYDVRGPHQLARDTGMSLAWVYQRRKAWERRQ